MTSQRSYNTLGMNVRDQLHRMRSAILLLGVLYVVAGPVWFLLQVTVNRTIADLALYTSLYTDYFVPFYFLALAVGTLGGFYATRYQNVPQQSNFYHSLPVTRSGLLSARILVLVLVQLLLLMVVTVVDIVVVLMATGFGASDLTLNLVGAAGMHFCYIMLVFLLALAVALFAGQLTANTVGQVLMTAVLHGTVPLVGIVLDGLSTSFTKVTADIGFFEHLARFNIFTGFIDMVSYSHNKMNAIHPAFTSAEDASNYLPSQLAWSLGTTLAMVVLAALLLAGTYVLYQRRAVEKAGDTLLYARVGSVIKGIYVILGGACCSLFFWQGMGRSLIGVFVGAIVAAVVVHMIAEMLYSMDVDGVRRHYPSSLVGLVVALAVMLGFFSGVLGPDKLPDASRVKGAVMSYDGEGDMLNLVNTEYARDPQTIEKVMAAAEEAQDKQVVVDWSKEDVPDVQSVTLAYDTAFGKTTRYYTLKEADAQRIMAPLLQDGKVNQAIWSSLADAKPEDIAEMYVMPVFNYFIGGNGTYLVENASVTNDGASSQVRDQKDGARRAEALLQAIQKDLAARDTSVLESREVAAIGLGVLYRDDYDRTNTTWGNNFIVYEGDKATTALLAEWREEGFLPTEEMQLTESLKGCEALVYDPAKGNGDKNAVTLSADDFIQAYLAGDLVRDVQVSETGVDVRDDLAIGLCSGAVADEDNGIVATYYLRQGAELPVAANTEG